MRKLLSVLLLAACASAPTPRQSFDPALLAEIDRTIESAIAERRLPGAVFHLEKGDLVYEKAYGNRALVPAVEPMTPDTIFDAASITKTVAATPAVWLLIERGKIGIDDPVQKYIPGFPHAEVTIRHLLTHTGGLRPDLDLRDPWSGYDTAMKLINEEKLTNKSGHIFRYSDIGFELLGDIVQRVSGTPFDQFVKREIFAPLRMNDSGFNPPVTSRIAPTEPADGVMLRGVVHDPTARRMGGVAGHAGLFTTAADLARFFRALLRGGSPILEPETVKMMTAVQSPANVAVKRAGGFDYDSGFSRPRGDYFPLGSYGHTGFTGGAFWVDPQSKTFYILLSNRVHPDGKGNVDALRREVANLSARAAGYSEPVVRRVGLIMGGSAANGIDVVAGRAYEPLRGMRIGLITNHTGIDRSGNPTIDLLRSAPGVNLVALFSPEHGIRGTDDKEKVGDTTDTVSGLPIYSLYDGPTRKPKPEQLANLDALVFDIQDIGCRFYTYISTLGLAMEAAAENKKKFIVLDRVNPITGVSADFEGPLLKGEPSFVAWHPITVSHGMTVGEIAKMFNEERDIHADLTVIEVRGWKRDQFQDEAGLPWINTSPNMRSLAAATLYPGTGLLESALSVGRGTPTPFEILGAPYVKEKELADELNALGVAGVSFAPIRFTPTTSTYANQSCGGVRVTLADRHALKPVEMGVAIATAFQKLYPGQFEIEKMHRLLRDRVILDAIRDGKPWRDIARMWRDDEAVFAARRAKYLIYK
jgi:uncharacterized protein YbbC (DUF1343 family)/CubicO group peptidase (beta-lactamase class C family)